MIIIMLLSMISRVKRMKEDKRMRSGTPGSIRESLKKATTEMLVLYVLRRRAMYTYEMMQEIQTLSGGTITFNTLYQAIYRLQDFGYIVEDRKEMVDNRTRVYFTVNPAGKEYLRQLIREYQDFTNAVDRVLNLDRNKKGGGRDA